MKKVLVLLLVTAALSLAGTGCKSDEHPSGDHPKADQPKSDHPDHPK